MDGKKNCDISELPRGSVQESARLLKREDTHPERDSTPRLIPHLSSVSRGPPNLMYDVLVASLNVGFAVDSKLWSIESMNPSSTNRVSFSLSLYSWSVHDSVRRKAVFKSVHSRNSRARKLTNTDPAIRPMQPRFHQRIIDHSLHRCLQSAVELSTTSRGEVLMTL